NRPPELRPGSCSTSVSGRVGGGAVPGWSGGSGGSGRRRRGAFGGGYRSNPGGRSYGGYSSPSHRPRAGPGGSLGVLASPRKPGGSCFFNGCLPALRAGWTHTISTGCDGQPGRQNILRRIDVAVVRGATGARPLSHIERELLDDRSTRRASLARRIPAIDRYHLSAVPGCLVLQLPPQLRPARVDDRTRKGAVAHHVAYRQILDDDHLVFVDQPRGQFVQVIPPAVGDTAVDFRHRGAGFRP